MRIADRLREIVLDSGATERQVKNTLADVCGIKYQAVHQWFNSTNPTPENLALIAKHYNVSLLWLITGEGSKHNLVLDTDELEIITWWRRFPPDSKRLIIAQQKAFLHSLEQQDQS